MVTDKKKKRVYRVVIEAAGDKVVASKLDDGIKRLARNIDRFRYRKNY